MHRIMSPNLARMAVVLLMVCGVLLLGSNSAAWATPAQQQSTVPTLTPAGNPEPQLSLGEIRCQGQTVRVEFIVSQIPGTLSNAGTVSYVFNGQTRTAGFSSSSGSTASYVGTIPPPAQASNGVYNITSASVTLTAGGVTFTPTLQNPNQFTIICRTTGRGNNSTPTPTPINQNCPQLVNQVSVSPNGETELRSGPWRLLFRVVDCRTDGRFELRLLGPGTVPPPNSGEFFVGAQVEVLFFDSNNQLVSQPNFGSPIRLCFDLSADDLARAGGGNLTLQTFDAAAAAWVALAASTGPNSVCAELPHLSLYAVSARDRGGPPPAAAAPPVVATPKVVGVVGSVPRALPNTSAAGDGLVPTWLWALIGLLMCVGSASLAWRRLRLARATNDPPAR